MPPKRLVKDPVPPPADGDVYLCVERPEAVQAVVVEKSRIRPTDTFLRLTSYDQRFLQRFGIRVP